MSQEPPNTILRQLSEGELSLQGLVTWGSNYTFLGQICHDDIERQVIYKPRRGERPLWDFQPGTLCQRERAAFLVSEALDWGIVPPTVLREGPHGFGSVQLFIDHDPNKHYFTIEGADEFAAQLQHFVLFDYIINNADRKAGHVLLADDEASAESTTGKLYAIDHGICFHEEYKLRSVIWEFAGEPISAENIATLERFISDLNHQSSILNSNIRKLIAPRELDAMVRRTRALVRRGQYPSPGPGRHYPWPMI